MNQKKYKKNISLNLEYLNQFFSDMPLKRSRSKERERKRRQRAGLSAEDSKEKQLKARYRMKKRRENMKDVEKEEFKVKFRKEMQKHREKERNESGRKESCIDPLWPPGLKYGETPRHAMKGTGHYRGKN